MKRYVPAKIEAGYQRYLSGETMTVEEMAEFFALMLREGRAWTFPQAFQRDVRRFICMGLVDYDGPIPASARH